MSLYVTPTAPQAVYPAIRYDFFFYTYIYLVREHMCSLTRHISSKRTHDSASRAAVTPTAPQAVGPVSRLATINRPLLPAQTGLFCHITGLF